MADHFNPETGKSKARELSTGHIYEVHAIDVRDSDGWEFVSRDSVSVNERIEAMSEPDLRALWYQNSVRSFETTPRDHLVKTLTEEIRTGKTTLTPDGV